MRHAPGDYRRIASISPRHEMVRGVFGLLLMLALAAWGLSLWAVLILPLLAYGGLWLLTASVGRPLVKPSAAAVNPDTLDETGDIGLSEPAGPLAPIGAGRPTFGAARDEDWPPPVPTHVEVTVDHAPLVEPAATRVGGDQAGGSSLTPRELEVLRLVAAGRSNQEIADMLFITVSTAKRHVTNILEKLDLPSRSAASAWAHRRGLA
jgi:DNA-binding CsgD family transcriptional regulator